MDDIIAEQLIDCLTAKQANAPHNAHIPESDIRGIVGTTVADTLLVVEGALSVSDFDPEGSTHV